ncbi:integrase [Enterobacter sp. 10-1]|nr:integrase [Enterobacter sp. 10-1]
MSPGDTKIRSLKPSANLFKVSDYHGLYLLAHPGGSRPWYPPRRPVLFPQ